MGAIWSRFKAVRSKLGSCVECSLVSARVPGMGGGSSDKSGKLWRGEPGWTSVAPSHRTPPGGYSCRTSSGSAWRYALSLSSTSRDGALTAIVQGRVVVSWSMLRNSTPQSSASPRTRRRVASSFGMT
jgi:hypothetical protein